MLILIGFAFLAGVFTILSPCILPILPAILSAGTLKGKWRPLGIILGLVISFTFFTLALTAIVHATGLSPDILRYLAIAMIFGLGIIMIFPKLSQRFAAFAAPVAVIGQNIQGSEQRGGFIGGFIFGIALGLLWTPCAGPILAAITTLVATQSVNFTIVLITLAYSIGAAIPMYLIAYGGSKVIQSSRFLSRHAEGIRQFFGVLMILTALAIAFHWDMLLQQKIATVVSPVLIENNSLVKQQLEKLHQLNIAYTTITPDVFSDFGQAPELTGIVNWINSPPLSLKMLRGKVILIDFWTYSCINCLRTLPYIEKWYADYKDDGLIIIGVHTPEFEFEKDPKNVTQATMRLGIKYPVAQDNDYKTWQAYHNQYWPAHYLIDAEGNLRLVHFGEGAYVETENAIRTLLGMQALEMKEPERELKPLSPETYLGTARGHSYTSEITINPETETKYDYKNSLKENQLGLKGLWLADKEKITSGSNESYLDLNFLASQVYLVMSGSSSTPLEVYLDGKKYRTIIVDGDRKYDIVSVEYGQHLLSLKIPKGVSAYAFTFGTAPEK